MTETGIIRWYSWEAQTTPFRAGTCTSATQERPKSGSAGKATKQSEEFCCGLGCLPEDLSQKPSEVHMALHFASARIRAGIRICS